LIFPVFLFNELFFLLFRPDDLLDNSGSCSAVKPDKIQSICQPRYIYLNPLNGTFSHLNPILNYLTQVIQNHDPNLFSPVAGKSNSEPVAGWVRI
jgi:hypothetical protein